MFPGAFEWVRSRKSLSTCPCARTHRDRCPVSRHWPSTLAPSHSCSADPAPPGNSPRCCLHARSASAPDMIRAGSAIAVEVMSHLAHAWQTRDLASRRSTSFRTNFPGRKPTSFSTGSLGTSPPRWLDSGSESSCPDVWRPIRARTPLVRPTLLDAAAVSAQPLWTAAGRSGAAHAEDYSPVVGQRSIRKGLLGAAGAPDS